MVTYNPCSNKASTHYVKFLFYVNLQDIHVLYAEYVILSTHDVYVHSKNFSVVGMVLVDCDLLTKVGSQNDLSPKKVAHLSALE